MWPDPQETADLVTFTVEVLNGKLHFLSSVLYKTVVKFRNTSKAGIAIDDCTFHQVS